MQAANLTQGKTAHKRSRRVILALALGIATTQAHSQSVIRTTTISGSVTDPGEANIPGAAISLESSDGTTLKTTTDENGHFLMTATPGHYILKVMSPGFRNHEESVELAGNPIKKSVLLQIATGGSPVVVVELPPIGIIQTPVTSTLALNPLPPLKLHKRIAR